MDRDIEIGVLRLMPVFQVIEGAVTIQYRATPRRGQQRALLTDEWVGWVLRPSRHVDGATPDERRLCVGKSGITRRIVAQRHTVARAGGDDSSVGARDDVATGFRFAGHVTERIEPAADSTAPLEDRDLQPCFLEGECRFEPREAGTDDDDVGIRGWVQHATNANMALPFRP